VELGRRDLAAYQAGRPTNYFTADRFLQAVLSRLLARA